MNKRQIIASLSDIANTLDNSGLYKEASSLTNVMKRIADDSDNERVPLDKRPSWYFDYDKGREPTLRNFDPLMPVEGQEISRQELWEKFLEYLRKYKVENIADHYYYTMWKLLCREHGMESPPYGWYKAKLRGEKYYTYMF